MSRLVPCLLLASLALTGADAIAQSYSISPVRAATNTGSSNAYPFTSTVLRRYQQIHSDLPAMPMSITAIGFRITPTNTTYTGYRALDFDLSMGRSLPWNACSFYFDKNWVGSSKTLVVARKTLNFGPGVGASPGPSPFVAALELKLDKPYLRVPIGSLAWEMSVYSNVANGSIGSIDAQTCSSVAGSTSVVGSGCTATGRSTAMLQQVICQDRAGTLLLVFSASNCPANAPAIVSIGATNPNLSIPGLCTSLYSDLLLVLPIGTAAANGDLNRQGGAYYYDSADGIVLAPNPGPLTLYTQIFCFDAGQSGLPFAATNGLTISTPTANTAAIVEVTRLVNNTGGVTEPMSACWNTSSVGYGLVTRFTH